VLLLGYHYYSCREGITLFNTEMVISRQMIGFTIRILLLLIVTARMYAAGVDGIWTGQTPGRNGEVQDISFQFRLNGNTLTGKMFGDEFDLPIEEGSTTGDQIKFTITTTNYYNGNKTKFIYTGTIRGDEIELNRERAERDKEEGDKRQNSKQTVKLKRL
jgi:hypothetical protein